MFEGRLPRVERSGSVRRRYDVAGNGDELLVTELMEADGSERGAEIVVVQNWLAELQRPGGAEP